MQPVIYFFYNMMYALPVTKPVNNLLLRMVYSYLLSVFFILNGVHCTAWPGCQGVVKLGVLTKSTGITQKRVAFIVVNRSGKNVHELLSL